MENELNAQQISIFLMVPFKTEKVELNLDAIVHPDLKTRSGLSNLPYITSTIKYPNSLIKRLTLDGYQQIVSFFFDKTQFEKKIYTFGNVPDDDDDDKTTALSEDKVLEYNTIVMLKLLFPTYYPSSQNVSNSYNEYILGSGADLSYKTVFSLFSKITTNSINMSYVKVDGKPYTITKTTLLNDLLNHPVYTNVIKQYFGYSLWAKKQEKLIETDLKNTTDKFMVRLNTETGKQGDLSLFKYIEPFTKMIHEPDTTVRIVSEGEYQKRWFQSTLPSFIQMISSLYPEDKSKELKIDTIYETLNNIKDLYARFDSYNVMTKKPLYFKERVDNVIKEVKKIIDMKTIKDIYIIPRNINVNLDEENEDIVKLLNSKYKPYIDFVEVIRSIIKPTRESTNPLLQECINNYSKNRTGKIELYGETIDVMKFNDILEKVHQKYMYSIGRKNVVYSGAFISDDEVKKYMNVGVNKINIDEKDKPHYEIYVSMNLIENEYTPETIQSIKCAYDGFLLGKELEDTMNHVNPYEARLHTLYVSKNDIDSQLQQKPISDKNNASATNAPATNTNTVQEKKVGGKKTTKRAKRGRKRTQKRNR